MWYGSALSKEANVGWSFRKSVRLLPGLRLNISKSGLGLSAGRRGARVSTGPSGHRVTLGAPGSGLSWTKRFGRRKRRGKA